MPRTMKITDGERRALARWAADCAERVLPLFEAEAPKNRRPREAIEAAREFVRTGKRTKTLRDLIWAAIKTSSKAPVNGTPGSPAAFSAGIAAGTAFMHPYATLDQARHILGPIAYAARARALADGEEAGAAEVRWAVRRAPVKVRSLLARMPARKRAGKGWLEPLLLEIDQGLRAPKPIPASRSAASQRAKPALVRPKSAAHPTAPRSESATPRARSAPRTRPTVGSRSRSA